jgi:hypothetical protein
MKTRCERHLREPGGRRASGIVLSVLDDRRIGSIDLDGHLKAVRERKDLPTL